VPRNRPQPTKVVQQENPCQDGQRPRAPRDPGRLPKQLTRRLRNHKPPARPRRDNLDNSKMGTLRQTNRHKTTQPHRKPSQNQTRKLIITKTSEDPTYKPHAHTRKIHEKSYLVCLNIESEGVEHK